MNKSLFVFFIFLILCLPAFAQSKEARKIDEFGFDITCYESKVKVDAFALELFNNPDSRGYIVFYEGRNYPMPDRNLLPHRNEARTRVNEFVKNYMALRRLDKMSVIDGGYREKFTIEFWMVPQGMLPVLAPTVKPENIKFRKGKYHYARGEGC